MVDMNQLRIGTSAPAVCLFTLLAVMGCAHTAQKGELDQRQAQRESSTAFLFDFDVEEIGLPGSEDLTLEVEKTREELSLAKYRAGEYNHHDVSWETLTDELIGVHLGGKTRYYVTDANGRVAIDVEDFEVEKRKVQEVAVSLVNIETRTSSLGARIPNLGKRMAAKNASRNSGRQDRTEHQGRREPEDNTSSNENRGRDNGGTATSEEDHSKEDAAPSKKIVSPVGRATVTSNFGAPRQGYKHEGVDFQASTGEKVRAWRTGTVIETGWKGGYGRIVKLRHLGPYSTLYAHLSKIEIREGEEVRTGETIGRAGATGNTTGSHLHFEIRKHDQAVDPAHYLSILR